MSRNLARLRSFILSITICLVLLLSACDANSTPASFMQPTQIDQRSEETEAAKIYTLLLNEHIKGGNPILIDNLTLSGEFTDDENIIRWVSGVDQETLTNFRSVNQRSKDFDLNLSLNRDYAIVANRNKSDWESQALRYPNSDLSVSFSSIGFNRKSQSSAGLCRTVPQCGLWARRLIFLHL